MRIAAFLILIGLTVAPAQAMCLEGGVEKTDVEGRIGVRISCTGKIAKVHPGSPADEVGLQKNDTVVTVDGRKHAISEISGEPGTQVTLHVKRKGQRFVVAVERRDIREIYY